MVMQELKIMHVLPLLHTFPFIMYYVFIHKQSTYKFSRPQNSAQAVEIHMAGSVGLFSNFHW